VQKDKSSWSKQQIGKLQTSPILFFFCIDHQTCHFSPQSCLVTAHSPVHCIFFLFFSYFLQKIIGTYVHMSSGPKVYFCTTTLCFQTLSKGSYIYFQALYSVLHQWCIWFASIIVCPPTILSFQILILMQHHCSKMSSFVKSLYYIFQLSIFFVLVVLWFSYCFLDCTCVLPLIEEEKFTPAMVHFDFSSSF
jgi:hypothetical protein